MPLEAITTVAWDPLEEALWTGTATGRIVSYLMTPTMDKYSSWRAHDDSEVKQLLFNEGGVISLSYGTVRYQSRGGLVHFIITPDLEDLQAMTWASHTQLLVGGNNDRMFVLDLDRGSLVKEIPVSSGVTCLKRSRLIVCGSKDGQITLRDSRTYRVEHTLRAHAAGVTDIDVKGDLLVSCGLSTRMGQVFFDPFVRVFDLRMMQMLPPISFPFGTIALKFHPKFSSTLIIVSQTGVFQLCDVQGSLDTIQNYHVKSHFLSSFDISSTGGVLAFGDTAGYIHLWSDSEDIKVNAYSRNTLELLDLRPPPPRFRMTEQSSFVDYSMIPVFRRVKEPLLSEWPSDCYLSFGKPHEPVDPNLLKQVVYAKPTDFVGEIPVVPGTKLRNQVRLPKPPPEDHSVVLSSTKTAMEATAASASPKIHQKPPKAYRKIAITATKLGVDDFDFRTYNKSNFGGLENFLPQNYINPLLFVFYFVSQLRVTLLNHLCLQEFCVTCEFGFLFHMLDVANGATVHATNLIRCLREVAASAKIDIFDEAKCQCNLSHLIKKANTFFLSQIHRELQAKGTIASTKRNLTQSADSPPTSDPKTSPPTSSSSSFSSSSSSSSSLSSSSSSASPSSSLQPPSSSSTSLSTPSSTIIDQLFSTTLRTTVQCNVCRRESVRESRVHQISLQVPTTYHESSSSFALVLRNTLASTTSNTLSWCEHCQCVQICDVFVEVITLPNILCLHCPVTTADSSSILPFWSSVSDDFVGSTEHISNSWLPFKFRVWKDPKTGKLHTQEYSEKSKSDRDLSNDLYELMAVVSFICDRSVTPPREHLIAQLKVPLSYHQRFNSSPTAAYNWYLFNDFQIQPTSKYEAAHINAQWKIPVLLYYARSDVNERVPIPTEVNPITEEVLFLPNPFEHLQASKEKRSAVVPLTREELRRNLSGGYVAIDTEFVSLQNEEVAGAEGRKVIVKLGFFSLARVSVLRGWEPQCVPFIDDYISTPETLIKDYLTKYSGIKSGDLDPVKSPHVVTTLKHAYLKLRYLVDQGVKFVGHGLKKDFHTINLLVSKDQMIDTVELFHLKRQRKISLKFLAAYLLNLTIQQNTHDSIEDAKTAWLLYKKYQELVAEGKFESVLNEIYNFGRLKQWDIDFKELEQEHHDQDKEPTQLQNEFQQQEQQNESQQPERNDSQQRDNESRQTEGND